MYHLPEIILCIHFEQQTIDATCSVALPFGSVICYTDQKQLAHGGAVNTVTLVLFMAQSKRIQHRTKRGQCTVQKCSGIGNSFRVLAEIFCLHDVMAAFTLVNGVRYPTLNYGVRNFTLRNGVRYFTPIQGVENHTL